MEVRFNHKLVSLAGFAAVLCIVSVQPAYPISLKKSVSVALDSNPDIGQAIENREAHEFELRQAKGLLLPSLDLEASAGTPKAG